MIEITARGNRLRVSKRSNLIGGSVGVNPFRVHFDETWNEYYVTAVFTCNGVTKFVQIFQSGEEHQIPWEILAGENIGHTVAVGLYGVGKDDAAIVMQSEPVALDVLADGTDPNEPGNPSPSEFNNLLRRANEAINQASLALTEANSARDTAVLVQSDVEKRYAFINEKAVEVKESQTAAGESAAAASGFASIAGAHEESARSAAESAEASAEAAAYWAERSEAIVIGNGIATTSYADQAALTAENNAKHYADSTARTAEDNAKAYAVPVTRKINGKELTEDITLSAEDVGARAESWTPTAEEVGARANDWLPSCAEIGTLKQSLHSDETDPDEEGSICWQYE
ncbi:MAG: hypothetical protein PUB51_00565 [Oscillospiraceae bacterium]|nr:hypothetical protein [Oscillospiraceae bacterium]